MVTFLSGFFVKTVALFIWYFMGYKEYACGRFPVKQRILMGGEKYFSYHYIFWLMFCFWLKLEKSRVL